jgi:hypothetical protein
VTPDIGASTTLLAQATGPIRKPGCSVAGGEMSAHDLGDIFICLKISQIKAPISSAALQK